MDTSQYIQSCNPSRFVMTSSLLIFSILFALRIDEFIKISYWLVFLPLFIWKILVILGAATGTFVWCRNLGRNRRNRATDHDFQALIIYFLMHMLILTFELLACNKLEHHLDTRWSLCFIPLLICTLISFISCLWSIKVQRNFLIQGFISANSLFFLFFPFRLDYYITWRYAVVFIPIWISLCIALLFIIAKFIVAIMYRCSRRLLSNYRELTTVTEAIVHAILFISFSIFSILLADRLDQQDNEQAQKLTYTVIAIPLWISLIAWLTFSFGANDTNPWWFGLQRDLCEIIFERCPCMSIYFNNRFKIRSHLSGNDLISDVTVSAMSKTIESTDINKVTITDMNNENGSVVQHQFTALLEPD